MTFLEAYVNILLNFYFLSTLIQTKLSGLLCIHIDTGIQLD